MRQQHPFPKCSFGLIIAWGGDLQYEACFAKDRLTVTHAATAPSVTCGSSGIADLAKVAMACGSRVSVCLVFKAQDWMKWLKCTPTLIKSKVVFSTKTTLVTFRATLGRWISIFNPEEPCVFHWRPCTKRASGTWTGEMNISGSQQRCALWFPPKEDVLIFGCFCFGWPQ